MPGLPWPLASEIHTHGAPSVANLERQVVLLLLLLAQSCLFSANLIVDGPPAFHTQEDLSQQQLRPYSFHGRELPLGVFLSQGTASVFHHAFYRRSSERIALWDFGMPSLCSASSCQPSPGLFLRYPQGFATFRKWSCCRRRIVWPKRKL